mmetsp:Transcript_110436/g.219529  ORF Transcript_110436/g.219529 Transcript_110436/m.219529 type:complete len:322 (-) Transcript_110436:324-1289(-)
MEPCILNRVSKSTTFPLNSLLITDLSTMFKYFCGHGNITLSRRFAYFCKLGRSNIKPVSEALPSAFLTMAMWPCLRSVSSKTFRKGSSQTYMSASIHSAFFTFTLNTFIFARESTWCCLADSPYAWDSFNSTTVQPAAFSNSLLSADMLSSTRQRRGNSGTCHCKESPSMTAPSMSACRFLPALVMMLGRSPSQQPLGGCIHFKPTSDAWGNIAEALGEDVDVSDVDAFSSKVVDALLVVPSPIVVLPAVVLSVVVLPAVVTVIVSVVVSVVGAVVVSVSVVAAVAVEFSTVLIVDVAVVMVLLAVLVVVVAATIRVLACG